MKLYRTLIILFITTISIETGLSQSTHKPVYVIVHGITAGGWAFKKVDSLLTESGNTVYRPTLTGLGERVHLASTNIVLNTHISDIVNTILYENLHDVILIGHSYGGMVVTGVADSIPERIKKLIYIDAFIPEDGESAASITNTRIVASMKIKNGLLFPWWIKDGQDPPREEPHPIQTLLDDISLTNPKRLEIPSTYILTVDSGKSADQDDFYPQAERATKKNWTVLQLEADHNPQWSVPEELVEMLQEIARQ